ncbi:MAG TPA: uroporphyrinogen-III C-methyltransferase [Vicinamibacterales bacterium]|nr:uroporphyrinogen-III C-methyltransferase [Vicinamibacterales bacterium]
MGRVFIIGAGPGDPGLITARGVKLLSEADVIVYDRAVEAALRWARPEAERIAAGAPAEKETAQDAISMLIAEKARDGHTVARLKWGDPFVFDSGAKEALFLHEQGVQFEVVPGVPAAIGASAYAGIPLTYPGAGDALVLLRGHEDEAGRVPDIDWEALARVDGTIACYAGGRLIPTLLQKLLDHGVAPDAAAALIVGGTLPSQRTLAATVSELLERTSSETPSETALLIVGEVSSLREHLRWFDERPLFGRKIVVTRSQEQARELVDALENLGAEAIEAPTFRLAPPEDPEAVDRAAASVDEYSWVVFESANAVARFLSALSRGPRDLRALGRVRICAIGPSTSDRLASHGIKADVHVPELGAESIGDAIESRGSIAAQRVLVVRPDHLRGVVGEDLERRGAAVTDLVAYRTAAASQDSPAAQSIYRMLLDGQIDAVTFTSPTAVTRFAQLIGEEQAADLLNTTVVAPIGPVTAAAATELGITSTVMPETFTVEGLVKALVARFRH